MKKRNNRFLAGTLAGLMMLTMLPVTALAAQEGADGDAASDTSNNIVNVVSDDENGQQAVNINIAANGGTENAQESADDSENAQESADTAAANQREGESSGSDSGNTADTTPAAEQQFVAKIGTQTYESLDKAIEAAESGAEIEIGNDEGVITVNEIRKNLVINGNSHTITIPAQETDNCSLNISGSLTFNNTNVECANNSDNVKAWSISLYSNGVLTFDKGSTCTITKHGIYAHADSTINILGSSKLIIQNTTSTSMMADAALANINIEDGSEITITDAFHGSSPQANGINNFKIRVINSYLTVTHCENQGLVRCE